jgi:cellulose synthase/poly-beta-1,6-N-acetylglucosamine synthase-like glycosyltransferase
MRDIAPLARAMSSGDSLRMLPIAARQRTVTLSRVTGHLADGALLLLALLVIGWVLVDAPGAWATLGVLMLGLAFTARAGVARRSLAVSFLAPAVGLSALSYLTWRLTVVNWTCWWVAVPLFVAEAFGAVHTLGLQYTIWPRASARTATKENPFRRPIFIFIPTVNEGVEVLEPTICGALSARARYLEQHPFACVRVVVCNDGRVAGIKEWSRTEALALQLGVECVTRSVGGGAKAGNIENARQRVGAVEDALVVIFDADQIAEPEFLLEIIPHFSDPQVGWVQSGQYYRNLDNPVSKWADDQQALFYKVLCPGKSSLNSAFICGTNVIIRAQALDEIGGLPQNSVTEDFAASIDLHQRWRGMFVPNVLARGIGPMDLKSYFSQQRRWAIGTLTVLKTDWRRIFVPGYGGLTLQQRLQYALASTHYLCGVRDLIYLLSPLAFLATGTPAVRGATLPTFLYYFLPYWAVSQLAFMNVARGKSSFRGIIMGFASFPVLIGSLVTVITGRRVGFSVTAKKRVSNSSWGVLAPHILAAAACVIVLVAVVALRGIKGPAVVSMLWVLYTLSMLGGVFWLAALDARFGQALLHRWSAAVARIRTGWLGKRVVWRPAALALLAGVTAVSMANMGLTRPRAMAFVPAREGTRYLGITLQQSQLATRTTALQGQYGLGFAIVGRAQVISDTFDLRWARHLQAMGQRPWITLSFGVPGPVAYQASLPAIVNGVHDTAIKRWADQIRAFGSPVYLTLLQHVDRNWAVSSAVTNGGLPTDVPRAWLRVRQIFRQEGALNVAWVWSPADPIHDQAYAPPASSIDLVQLGLISYPGTIWAVPSVVLRQLVQRYPAKPIILELTASGAESRKAAWVAAVGRAVADTPSIYAVAYHDGSPAVHATAADNASWSLASSPATLASFRGLVRQDQLRTSVAKPRSSAALAAAKTVQTARRLAVTP